MVISHKKYQPTLVSNLGFKSAAKKGRTPGLHDVFDVLGIQPQ